MYRYKKLLPPNIPPKDEALRDKLIYLLQHKVSGYELVELYNQYMESKGEGRMYIYPNEDEYINDIFEDVAKSDVLGYLNPDKLTYSRKDPFFIMVYGYLESVKEDGVASFIGEKTVGEIADYLLNQEGHFYIDVDCIIELLLPYLVEV